MITPLMWGQATLKTASLLILAFTEPYKQAKK